MALDGVMTGDEYLLGLDPFQKRQKKISLAERKERRELTKRYAEKRFFLSDLCGLERTKRAGERILRRDIAQSFITLHEPHVLHGKNRKH
jgi:hypothetical protein